MMCNGGIPLVLMLYWLAVCQAGILHQLHHRQLRIPYFLVRSCRGRPTDPAGWMVPAAEVVKLHRRADWAALASSYHGLLLLDRLVVKRC